VTKMIVQAGACGFTVTIEVFESSAQRFRVNVASDCKMVREWGKQLGDIHPHEILKFPKGFLLCASQYINHAACPVPVAVLKAIEVKAGIASPKDVIFHFWTAKDKQ